MKPRLRPRHPVLGLTTLFVAAIAISSYFLEAPRQRFYEARAASQLIKWWQMHEAVYPEVPITNTTQLFAELPSQYPYWLHEQFRIFGKHAGFERSLAEKYIIVHPSVSAPLGEIVLLNAKPYPVKRHMERTAILKVGDHYQIREMREERLQNVFHEAERTIPAATPMPRPPPPPAISLEPVSHSGQE